MKRGAHCVVTSPPVFSSPLNLAPDALRITFGDVVEHLTAPLEVLSDLVALLRPEGWRVAQGPLEAGPCLYSTVVRAARRFRRAHAVEMPPYHVLQATVRGQRVLFERSGLKTLEYRVSEVAWPAPERLSVAVARHPRSLGLFALRKVSQAVSALRPTEWGNRYFYVGVAQLPPNATLPVGSTR